MRTPNAALDVYVHATCVPHMAPLLFFHIRSAAGVVIAVLFDSYAFTVSVRCASTANVVWSIYSRHVPPEHCVGQEAAEGVSNLFTYCMHAVRRGLS